LSLLRVIHIAAVAMMVMPLACAAADNGRCGAGKDLVVQALERAGPQSSASDFEDALQLLKRASAVCGELGDAWYYRSLVEARLGHAGPAKFAADQARLLGSDAMSGGLQPFVLATRIGRRSIGKFGDPGGLSGSGTGPAGPVEQKWALVIGIGKFADRNIPSLNYTAGDAQAFAALLSDPAVGKFPKANVHLLTDGEATTKGIKEGLNWIARHAQANDMVVIYLATHGSPRETDSVGGLNYIVTYDTEIHSTDHPDEDALYATALPMVDLSSAVASRMHSLRTLVVLDTCFSGGAAKNGVKMMGAGLANAAPSAATLQRMSEGSGRIVMAASKVDQESLESDALHHGYFTYFLLKELRDSQGMKPLSQVYANVQQAVSERVAVDGKAEGLHQNPVMDRSSDEADFALGVAGTAAVASVGGASDALAAVR
jgi:Caspase domain